ncbi:exocyst complex component EXO70B2-like [Triticum dicoccoides]|uniref:exocyst complex component EXO70B2-like n=1 Tax=Triticum dicoccoides TaxID=85692 RepID=UPI001891AFB8|nr:exocyst complex component EXO70B2-like [Triticum dicoccoides]
MWKNLVFLSPAVNHSTLALCLHMSSSRDVHISRPGEPLQPGPRPFRHACVLVDASHNFSPALLSLLLLRLDFPSKKGKCYARIPLTDLTTAAAMHGHHEISSSSGGSSPTSLSDPSIDSDDGSATTDEYCPDDPREFRRHVSFFSPSVLAEVDPSSFRPISSSSSCVLADVDKHLQRMVLLLPAFSAAATAPRADALRQWLAGFDVGWVLDMDDRRSLPRREVGRRVRAWAQALGTMERVFRHRHRKVRNPVNDAAAGELAALGQLAAESAGAMLRLAGSVVALGSSPSKLLAALDVHSPVSVAYPGLARMFSWPPYHPVTAASDAALAGLVDASRRCVRDLRAFIRAPQYPWRMPQGGEVHPCVGFWMGYFRCMLRNRVPLYFVLAAGNGDADTDSPPTTPLAPDESGLVTELISCLEAVLEEQSAALAFPGLRHIFMLNNTSAILRRAVRSDLSMLLPPSWVLVREERMEGYIKAYLQVSWGTVVSRLDGKPGALNALRRRNPLSAFYLALENACSMQRGWKVPSPALRAALRSTVSGNVVPAYRRYLDDHPEVEVPAGRTAEELENQLSELFEG